jgi:hypothetical protein
VRAGLDAASAALGFVAPCHLRHRRGALQSLLSIRYLNGNEQLVACYVIVPEWSREASGMHAKVCS